MVEAIIGPGPEKTAAAMAALEAFLEEIVRPGEAGMAELVAAALPGGKRLRPRLVFLCASFAPYDFLEGLRAAAAVELVHLASLVHDDIIDNAPLRRGRASLYRLAGAGGAVLAGDYLFAAAFQLLATVRPPVLAALTEAIRLMCEGELEEQRRAAGGLAAYYRCAAKKTASLLAAACKSGGYLCGLAPYLVDYLGLYALSLGTAYQILDDLLDLTAEGTSLGKPARQDLAQGVLTLPVVAFLERSPQAAPWRERLWSGGRLEGAEAEALVAALAAEGYLEWAKGVALAELALSRAALAALPPGEAKNALLALTRDLPAMLAAPL